MAIQYDSDDSALELARELDQVLSDFVSRHGELLRRAVGAAPGAGLSGPALLTFFGHTLRRVIEAKGLQATERLVFVLLEQFTQAQRAHASAPPGTVH